METHRISSSATLLLLLMVPTLWAVFFGLFTLAMWIGGSDVTPLFSNPAIRWSVTVFYLFGLLLLRASFLRLKRIELDKDSIYITNFFKHARYSHESIEKMQKLNFGLFSILHIRLKEKGIFGQKIIALLAKSKFDQFMPLYPKLLEMLSD